MNPHEHYKFDDSFQDTVLACLCKHPAEFWKYHDIVSPSYFEGGERVIVAQAVVDYFSDHNKFPVWRIIRQVVHEQLLKSDSASKEEEVNDFLDRIEEIETSQVLDYVMKNVRWFARERATFNALRKAIDILNKKGAPPEGFQSLFEEAAGIGRDNSDIGLVLPDDANYVLAQIRDETLGTPCGFDLLDNIWPRGWKPGWLVVPLAPPKRFKTGFCINLANNIAGHEIGKPVIYYACEIDQTLAAGRALCNIAGMTDRDIHESPNSFDKRVSKALQQKFKGSTLIFKSFPSKSATMADIRNHAKMCVEELGLDEAGGLGAIVIDYAETVLPANKESQQSEHRRSAQVYTEARALAGEMGTVVIMPDRCNRETVTAAVPSMDAFQGSFEKAGIVDVGIGLCATDQELNDGIMRYFVFLNRHGEARGHFRGTVDPERMIMTIDEPAPAPEVIERQIEDARRAARGQNRGRNQQQAGDMPARNPELQEFRED